MAFKLSPGGLPGLIKDAFSAITDDGSEPEGLTAEESATWRRVHGGPRTSGNPYGRGSTAQRRGEATGSAGQAGGDVGFGGGSLGGSQGNLSDFDPDLARERRSSGNYMGSMTPEERAAYEAWANSPVGAAVGGDFATYAEMQNPRTGAGRAPIAAPSTYQDQARARQQELIDQLHGVASGQTTTQAQQLFQQQVQQAQNNALSAASDLRDVGPGGQAQIARQNQDRIAMKGTQSAAMLKEQQQRAAMDALTKLYEAQRNGDLNQADIDASNTLGNRALDDLLGTNTAGNRYNMALGETGIANAYTDANLGYGLEDSANNRALGQLGLQAGGVAASYLAQAGAGNSSNSNNQHANGMGYDIRDEGDK
jgi:hypothetical protein